METVACIDNYDSFTYNLVQMIQCAGFDTCVYRNDAVTIREIERRRPFALVVSPGPGRPESAGISMDAVRYFAEKIPILGVCLGHQVIARAFGGNVSLAYRVMHGKISRVHHDREGLFRGVNEPFEAVRYHSLMVESSDLPSCFRITAWTEKGEIMGIGHRELRVEGVQFHPESVLTIHGSRILANFFSQSKKEMKL
jgi:anthranilate synthase/aminodeoxychorismate synthase-like glutamine amidotransferase